MLLLLTYTSLAKRFFKCESVNLTTVDNKTQKHILSISSPNNKILTIFQSQTVCYDVIPMPRKFQKDWIKNDDARSKKRFLPIFSVKQLSQRFMNMSYGALPATPSPSTCTCLR